MRKLPPLSTDPALLFRHGGAAAGDLLDFSASINPLGPPASVLRVLSDGLSSIARYPDPDCRALTRRLEAEHGPGCKVVVGNGSNELIHAIARAVKPRRVAIVEPSYTEYLRASALVGAEVTHWLAEGDDFALEPFDPEDADLAWLCDPNNPTGQRWPAIFDWMAAHPRTIFVVDEAFCQLASGGRKPPVDLLTPNHGGLTPLARQDVSKPANVIVLRSLTKQFALPGLRLGYAVAPPNLAALLRAQLPPWSVNTLAQIAGLAALDDTEYRARTHAWLSDQVPSFAECLAAALPSVHVLPSATNFILMRLKWMTAARLTQRLATRGILIRDASNFVGLDHHFVRVAVRTAAENRRLLDALVATLEG